MESTECGTAAYSLQSGILNRSAITNQPRADDQILASLPEVRLRMRSAIYNRGRREGRHALEVYGARFRVLWVGGSTPGEFVACGPRILTLREPA